MSEAEKEAREEAERRWPDWVCPPVDEDPEPDYSEMDARWQNAESEMQRNAFVAGAEWQASRAPQPTEDEREALRLAVLGVLWNASNYPERVQPHLFGQDVRPLTESVMAAILAAGFRRAPAEPAVQGEPTDAQVEAAAMAWSSGSPTPSNWENMTSRLQGITKDRMRAALRAAFATRGTDDE